MVQAASRLSAVGLRSTPPNYGAACAAFRAYHPDKTEGLLNCSSVYDEEHFKQTEMYRSGNFDRRCHEVITLRREAATN